MTERAVNEDTPTLEDVRAAMDRGELFVEYQPIVSLVTQRCVGAEALVRWLRAGTVWHASRFVDLIENTPLSGRLTYWVIDTIAQELDHWLTEHSDIYISINVPPEILGRGGLEYAAVRSGLRAHVSQILLEITERGVPDQLGLNALNQMAEHGVRLALDDVFLSGANLAVLSRGRFEVIKIDRKLIAQLAAHAPDPAWLPGLRSLLTHSELQVIAEGVESHYQADALARAGVQMAQGFLFSSSLTARGLMRFLERTNAR
ncbi:EAL domain-containing protein [Peristeroidobacter agariperforans]|uniref:EAL domain-containing protein n=1 Tax=Peristeroidobacter agariperforans TaxID=268404 RepID=UPI0013002876|nr:EAL domain-containing protein [Peristeroidobacter agariperforans]